MTCHYVKDGIYLGHTRIENIAAIVANAPSYGWDTCTVSFVEDAPHTWRVLWSGAWCNRKRKIGHSCETYRTRREAVDAWNGALAVEALS